MKILVIDGQGGGLGKSIVERLKAIVPSMPVLALGTNALATAAMIRAGADAGATGENAILFNCRNADIILGATGIIVANAMLGEITPAIAVAVGESNGYKLLIPSERCNLHIIGVKNQTMDAAISEAVAWVQKQQDT
jgi:hypothetical protein